ncbi:transmembrane emp24 domain-containing protein 1b [Takifugu flavidus]|uniref:Transmembrane emp24 domain-containing protein 1 p24 family protein gamma-1 n=1 Tax=Takifugu flavidus TaxID=433684 RepID=A0A5C6MW54_9TELE|nr:transmembrane emp24 domain-containing protein 1b [Takifugu flavidus]TWW59524.1 Transmembrane emp24 domain-containing protein 1 p24 family protein gamma-1 [Takifugu flavidus]
MEFHRSRGVLWLLAFMFGWLFGSVSCFGSNLDSEFTFLLPAGRSECFFQTAIKNGTMEVEYQVIAGAGMDVDFTIVSPEGSRLIMESRRSDGVHVVEPTQEGDYEICFDNSFSHFSEKMVFFEIIIEGQAGDVGGDEEWAGLEEPDGSLLEYKLEDIRESMDSLHKRLERSKQMQTVLRAFEARDRNLLEDNLWRVSFWSCASVLVMLCVALTQVYTVRKLFDDKRRVCT